VQSTDTKNFIRAGRAFARRVNEHDHAARLHRRTRQNDGKTTTSLGLIAALQKHFPRVGYIKPVGQRFVEIEEQKIDEDSVLMDAVYRMNTPLVDMSPIASSLISLAISPVVQQTKHSSKNSEGVRPRFVGKRFVRAKAASRGRRLSFDLSNAQVAKILAREVIIVTQAASENRLTKFPQPGVV